VDRFVDLQDRERPTDYKYEDFKDIYLYAHEQGLKGCTTFASTRGVPGRAGQGRGLKNTTYVFTLEDGTEVEVKGDEQIEYDGEMHSARTCSTPERRLLRQVLTRPGRRARAARGRPHGVKASDERTQDRKEDREVPGREARRQGKGAEAEAARARSLSPTRAART